MRNQLLPAPKAPRIHVLELRETPECGNLRAFATLQIGALVISEFRVIQQPGQRAYVSPPQVVYEVNGRKMWKPVLRYPDVWKEAINSAVLTEYAKLDEVY